MDSYKQKLQTGMNKSKLTRYGLGNTRMASIPLTAENLQNACFILFSWDLKTGEPIYTKKNYFPMCAVCL